MDSNFSKIKKFFSNFFLRRTITSSLKDPKLTATCEEFGLRIKSLHPSDAAKKNAAVELMIHRRKAKKITTNCNQKLNLKRNKKIKTYFGNSIWLYAKCFTADHNRVRNLLFKAAHSKRVLHTWHKEMKSPHVFVSWRNCKKKSW